MWWDSDRAAIQAGECYRNVEALRQLRFAQLTKPFFSVVATPKRPAKHECVAKKRQNHQGEFRKLRYLTEKTGSES
jgi:hypothetical protein